MARIELRRVSKRFPPNVAALDSLDLEVRSGELLAVVGPSGSGKSTLLRLIAGLEQPTSGELRFDGQDVARVPPWGRGVALVFPHDVLHPQWTVAQNLRFGAGGRGRWWPFGRSDSDDDATADRQRTEVAALLGIDHLLPRRPASLSGGERQRVALGRAMLRSPRVLLLDEPLSSLDPRHRDDLRRAIRRLHERLDAATVYVTHDQSEALAVADRVGILHAGRWEQLGAPTEVYDAPQTLRVAQFLTSGGLNLLRPARGGAPGQVALWGVSRACSGAAAAVLQRGDLVLGVRPQHVAVSLGGMRTTGDGIPSTADSPVAEGRIASSEFGGDFHLVRVQAASPGQGGGVEVVAKVARSSAFAPGAECELRVRWSDVLGFDVPSGRRVEL